MILLQRKSSATKDNLLTDEGLLLKDFNPMDGKIKEENVVKVTTSNDFSLEVILRNRIYGKK